MENFIEYANAKGTFIMKKFILPFALALAILPLQLVFGDTDSAVDQNWLQKASQRLKLK